MSCGGPEGAVAGAEPAQDAARVNISMLDPEAERRLKLRLPEQPPSVFTVLIQFAGMDEVLPVARLQTLVETLAEALSLNPPICVALTK